MLIIQQFSIFFHKNSFDFTSISLDNEIMSIGKPLEHIRIKVLDENNCEMAATDSEHYGRMALRGGMQMAGYWNMPEQTQDAIQNGWLVTSDLVYLDNDGYVYMLGRVDDIINVGEKRYLLWKWRMPLRSMRE